MAAWLKGGVPTFLLGDVHSTTLVQNHLKAQTFCQVQSRHTAKALQARNLSKERDAQSKRHGGQHSCLHAAVLSGAWT